MRDGGTEAEQQEQPEGMAGTHSLSHSLSQDGLSLEFVASTAGKGCNIQDARGGRL